MLLKNILVRVCSSESSSIGTVQLPKTMTPLHSFKQNHQWTRTLFHRFQYVGYLWWTSLSLEKQWKVSRSCMWQLVRVVGSDCIQSWINTMRFLIIPFYSFGFWDSLSHFNKHKSWYCSRNWVLDHKWIVPALNITLTTTIYVMMGCLLLPPTLHFFRFFIDLFFLRDIIGEAKISSVMKTSAKDLRYHIAREYRSVHMFIINLENKSTVKLSPQSLDIVIFTLCKRCNSIILQRLPFSIG